MAQKTKRDLIRQGMTKSRRQLTQQERDDLGRSLLSKDDTPLRPLEKALFVLEAEDMEWLRKTVARLKHVRRRSNKSELMRLGISLMKEKTPEELTELLRKLG